MTRRTVTRLARLASLVCLLLAAPACTQSQRQSLADPATLDALERGGFSGELAIDTDGTVGGGFSQRFDLGPSKSFLHAKGRVDFSRGQFTGHAARSPASQPAAPVVPDPHDPHDHP